MNDTLNMTVDNFLILCSDDPIIDHGTLDHDPIKLLHEEWHNDKTTCINLIEFILSKKDASPIAIDMVCAFAISMQDSLITNALERFVLKKSIKFRNWWLVAQSAIECGSTKLTSKITDHLRKCVSMGPGSMQFDDEEVTDIIKASIILRIPNTEAHLHDLLSRRSEQGHRRVKMPLLLPVIHPFSFWKEYRLYGGDANSIKLAEVALQYFMRQPMRDYIRTLDPRTDQIIPALFCLAAERDENNYNCFKHTYECSRDKWSYKHFMISTMCIEGIVFSSSNKDANNFLTHQLKHAINRGEIRQKRYNPTIGLLLSGSNFIDNISGDLISSVKHVIEAKNPSLATRASLVYQYMTGLKATGCTRFERYIDTEKNMLLLNPSIHGLLNFMVRIRRRNMKP